MENDLGLFRKNCGSLVTELEGGASEDPPPFAPRAPRAPFLPLACPREPAPFACGPRTLAAATASPAAAQSEYTCGSIPLSGSPGARRTGRARRRRGTERAVAAVVELAPPRARGRPAGPPGRDAPPDPPQMRDTGECSAMARASP